MTTPSLDTISASIHPSTCLGQDRDVLAARPDMAIGSITSAT